MTVLDSSIDYAALAHILVVDDDDRIRSLVARYLNDHGFLALSATDAMQAEEMLRFSEFDALVVDIMMPGKTGLEWTKELRAYSDIPVLLLTALGEVDDKVLGLDAGADDYLAKPFEPKELVARLKAMLRRKPAQKTTNTNYKIGEWTFDSELGVMESAAGSVKLTEVESRLLKVLVQRSGEILSRDALAKLCQFDDAGERTIDVQVTRLRRKIESDTKNPRLLVTVRGKGYLLRDGGPA